MGARSVPIIVQNLFTNRSFFDCFVPNGAERGNWLEALSLLALRRFFVVSLLCQTKRYPTTGRARCLADRCS